MPNWNEILDEIKEAGSTHDLVRRRYIRKLSEKTGRNTVIYYSGWLQASNGHPGLFSISDQDKTGFMSAFNGIERAKGLDLVLHTPGGDIAATESIVDYIKSMFDDFRVIVPQIAMSAGTMIACSANSIVMGKQSNLGPIDPQYNGIPAHGIIEEFDQAANEIRQDQSRIPVWQPIIAKYNPTLIGECRKASAWAVTMVTDWLLAGMANGNSQLADQIVQELGDHSLTLSHNRHLSAQRCKDIGLTIEDLEADQDLQDAVLSVHHAAIHTMMATGTVKIIENQNGTAYINTVSLARA